MCLLFWQPDSATTVLWVRCREGLAYRKSEGGKKRNKPKTNTAVILPVWVELWKTTNELRRFPHLLFFFIIHRKDAIKWWVDERLAAARMRAEAKGTQNAARCYMCHAAYWHSAAACDEEPAEGIQHQVYIWLVIKNNRLQHWTILYTLCKTLIWCISWVGECFPPTHT